MNPRTPLAVTLAAAIMLAACGPEAPPTAATAATPSAARKIARESADSLRTRATAAMAEGRLFAPAGDNAAELLLELRQRGRAAAGDVVALSELQPYLVIAVEQAVERRTADEAQRLVDLLVRLDDDAPAIPRLRTAVQDAREAAAGVRAEAERIASTAPRATPVNPATRPVPPTTLAPPASVAPAADPVAVSLQPAPQPVPMVDGPSAPAPATRLPAEPPLRVAPALRLVQDVQPRYPARALERRVDGRVELMFTVRPDGSVADLRVVDAAPAGVFDQAALQAARRWRFAPIPVAATTTRALRFTPPQG